MKKLILALLLSPLLGSAHPIIQPYIDDQTNWAEIIAERQQFEQQQYQEYQYQQQLLDELAAIRAALEQGR